MKGAARHDRRTILTNAVWNWAGFGTRVVVTFVMCPILVHGLGDERYGIWSLVEATVAYFALLDLGIGASVVRYVAKFEEIDDRDQLDRVFSTTMCIFAVLGALVLAVCGAAAWFWTRPLGVTPELAVETRWLLLLLGANVAIELVVGVFGSVLYGLGRFPARVTIDLFLRFGSAAAMYMALTQGGGVVGVVAVVVASTALKGLFQAVLVRWYLPSLRLSWRLVDRATFRLIRGYSARAFTIMCASRVSMQSAPIIIGAFLSPQYITFYTIGGRLIGYVRDSVATLTAVLTPAISAFEARSNHDAIRRAYLTSSRLIVWLVLPVQLGLLFFGKPFLTLWLGPEYAMACYPVLVLLALPLIVAVPQTVGGRILYGMGQLRELSYLAIGQALVNIALSIALVRRWGIEGVAVAIAVQDLIYAGGVLMIVSKRMNFRVHDYVRESFAMPVSFAMVPLAIWYAIGLAAPPTSWLAFVGNGFVGVMCYWGIAAWIEFRPLIIQYLRRNRRGVQLDGSKAEV